MVRLRDNLFFIIFLGLVQYGYAVGTVAGTNISNQASIGFKVNGVDQIPLDSNIHSFLVDRVVNLSFVKNDLAHVAAVPNQTNVIASYTVTNLGNGVQDFNIAVAQQASGATDAFGSLDSANLLSASVRVDGNANGIYDAALDTLAFVDELAPDASLAVFIRGRFAASAINGQIAGINVTARARAAGVVGVQGANLTATAGADTIATVDTVFADGIGTGTGDVVRDSRVAALSSYKVVTAVIGVTKVSSIISDTVSGFVNPKAIPGAVVEYTISVTNSGSANASAVIVADTLALNLTYTAASILVDGVSEDDDAVGADEADSNGGSYTAGTRLVRAALSALNIGETKSIKFRATVN